MKVFARIMTDTSFDDNEIKHDLGLVIEHKGIKYTLGVDNSDRLILRSIDKPQLIVLPHGSNSIELKGE